MGKKFDHFIITLWNVVFEDIFNVKVREWEQPWGEYYDSLAQDKRLDPTWLEYRASIFKKFTAPSIKKQSCKDFTWIIVFDERTPLSFVQSLGKDFVPLLVQKMNIKKNVQAKINSLSKTDWILSTNLDNDDALSLNFIEELHKQVTLNKELIIPVTGVRISTPDNFALSLQSDKNPFVSLMAPKRENLSCVSDMHGQFAGVPVKTFDTAKWLQVCHGDNLANRMKKKSQDQYQPFTEYCSLFGLCSKDFPCKYPVNGRGNIYDYK